MLVTENGLDAVDRAIIDLLVEDARRTVRDIADRVGLSAAPVQRRVHRLEQRGVITGYTAVINQHDVAALEAFSELQFAGRVEIDAIFDSLTAHPEVVAVYTTAGESDALVHLRVDDVAHLQQVINRLRKGGEVVGTRTRVVLECRRGRDHRRDAGV